VHVGLTRNFRAKHGNNLRHPWVKTGYPTRSILPPTPGVFRYIYLVLWGVGKLHHTDS